MKPTYMYLQIIGRFCHCGKYSSVIYASSYKMKNKISQAIFNDLKGDGGEGIRTLLEFAKIKKNTI